MLHICMHLEEEDAGIVVTFSEILTKGSIADRANVNVRVKYMTPNSTLTLTFSSSVFTSKLQGLTSMSTINNVNLTLVNTIL